MHLLSPLEKGYLIPNMCPEDTTDEAIHTVSKKTKQEWDGCEAFYVTFDTDGCFLPKGFFESFVCVLARLNAIFKRDEEVLFSQKRVVIFGWNDTPILLFCEEDQNRIKVKIGKTGILRPVAKMVEDTLKRLRNQTAKGLKFSIMSHVKELDGQERPGGEFFVEEKLEAKNRRTEVIVVSSPESGPLQLEDGTTEYIYDVMGALRALSDLKLVTIGYDWKNSSNFYPEDDPLWEKYGEKKPCLCDDLKEDRKCDHCRYNTTHAKDEPRRLCTCDNCTEKAECVRHTKWFQAYKGQVKGTVRAAVTAGKRVEMVVIEGGGISCVECDAMPGIKREIIQDLKEGCNMLVQDIRIDIKPYKEYQIFEKKFEPKKRLEDMSKNARDFLEQASKVQQMADQIAELQAQLKKAEEDHQEEVNRTRKVLLSAPVLTEKSLFHLIEQKRAGKPTITKEEWVSIFTDMAGQQQLQKDNFVKAGRGSKELFGVLLNMGSAPKAIGQLSKTKWTQVFDALRGEEPELSNIKLLLLHEEEKRASRAVWNEP